MPLLFEKLKEKSIICERCQLAKHTKQSYPTRLYQSTQPFNLVHSDIEIFLRLQL